MKFLKNIRSLVAARIVVCRDWFGSVVPFLGAETYYQAQVRDEDPEWQCWVNIGWQTKSRVCIRRFLAEELAKRPDAQLRVRRVRIWYRDIAVTPFLPNDQDQTQPKTKNQ